MEVEQDGQERAFWTDTDNKSGGQGAQEAEETPRDIPHYLSWYPEVVQVYDW